MPKPRAKPDAERDVFFMRLAVAQALLGLGHTRPNPAVGAVLVRADNVIGIGHHRAAGRPHAEIEAIANAGSSVVGATLYVTLEPCDHFGRTPPCAQRLVAERIERVVVGCVDPNPRVRGRGIDRLRRAGLQVEVGVLEAECRALIAGYSKHVRSGRPLVIMKAAVSLDGRLATASGESAGLTGRAAHRHLHLLRAASDAIAVGVGTVLVDDPRLTARPARLAGAGSDLIRLVIDSRGRTPPGARIVTGQGRCLIATTQQAPAARLRRLARAGAEILVCRSRHGRVALDDLLDRLGQRGLMTVLVEGGGQIHASLVRERLVDRAIIYVAPRLIGGDGVALLAGHVRSRLDQSSLIDVCWQQLGRDAVVSGRFAGGS
ncbi:MAG: bifunctional diaminohydroxyphosphoribosylaminopyrimidine deaminase/5-amino-6-(5-phosphoribosylamino)uracil reductase RibD [Deltaproteobacteria bacterium]|nr:bifunctional diaminohydroxyphosphoribosylaminopyrimidine deaminase/5-amino-6-(5-phosphoribosylamino)uracil reductase RibD [Deltaproteobacteria bacterium]